MLYNKSEKIIFETVDHTPDDEEEKNRIKENGGFISQKKGDVPRVNEFLAPSRVIGNCHLAEKITSCTPDVTEIQRTGDEQFLLLACDGLWDVMSNKSAHTYILNFIKDEQLDINNLSQDNLQDIVKELIALALTLGSTDNITVSIIYFQNQTYENKIKR